MLRARYCSFCEGEIPSAGRIDRMYCRASCRTLAYRHRREGRNARRAESSSLLDAVRRLEERAIETARELAEVRKQLATASASRSQPDKAAKAQQEESSAKLAATLRALQETADKLRETETRLHAQQRELSEHSQVAEYARNRAQAAEKRVGELEAEGRRFREVETRSQAQQRELSELSQREAEARRAAQFAAARVDELEAELRRIRAERREYEPPPPAAAPSAAPWWTNPEPKDSAQRPPRKAASAWSPVTAVPKQKARPKPPAPKSSAPKPTALKPPALKPQTTEPRNSEAIQDIEQIAVRTARKWMPGYLRLHRPDLSEQLKSELRRDESSIKWLCQAIARHVEAVVSGRRPLHDLDQFAADTVERLRAAAKADPVKEALYGSWLRREKSLLRALVWQITVAGFAEESDLND